MSTTLERRSTLDRPTDERAADERQAHELVLARHLASVTAEGERLARIAAAGDWDAPIAACPGWDLRELVRHVGLVHLWAAANIRFPSTNWISVDHMSDLAEYWPDHTSGWPPDEDLADWYLSTLRNMLDVFESCDPDHDCLTFVPAPTPLIMWARRQASEIAVHRHDAEAALGQVSHFEPEFAADMLDELLAGFAPRMKARDIEGETVLRLTADDGETDVRLTIGPSGISFADEVETADLRVSGSTGDLYLLMWNRTPGRSIRFDGDETVLGQWAATCRINWI